MSDFVFTLKVKTPKPSMVHFWRHMIVIESNVRIPDNVLDELQLIWPEPIIERLRKNHVIIFHTQQWKYIGDACLRLLVSAPAGSRRNFPAQVITRERETGRIIEWVQYPILPRA